MAWMNDDDLYIKYGTEKTDPGVAGEYVMTGSVRMIELRFDYTMLPAVATGSTILSDTMMVPLGAVVEKVEIQTYVDWDSSGDSMTLNVGFIDADDRTSNADVDAFVVAATQTELITGGTNIAGWIGAEVGSGQAMAATKLLTWEVDSQAATAGEGVIRLYYTMP